MIHYTSNVWLVIFQKRQLELFLPVLNDYAWTYLFGRVSILYFWILSKQLKSIPYDFGASNGSIAVSHVKRGVKSGKDQRDCNDSMFTCFNVLYV